MPNGVTWFYSQDEIVSSRKFVHVQPEIFSDEPLHSVAVYGIANLFDDRDSQPRMIETVPIDQDGKTRRRDPPASAGRGQKFPAFPHPVFVRESMLLHERFVPIIWLR